MWKWTERTRGLRSPSTRPRRICQPFTRRFSAAGTSPLGKFRNNSRQLKRLNAGGLLMLPGAARRLLARLRVDSAVLALGLQFIFRLQPMIHRAAVGAALAFVDFVCASSDLFVREPRLASCA